MFQKSGETADDLLPVQFFRRTAVFFRFQSCPGGTEGPGIFHHFLRPELFLDGEEHLPFQFGERNGFRFLHGSRFRGFFSGPESPAAHVSHSQRKDAARRQQNIAVRSDMAFQDAAVFFRRTASHGHLDRGPEPVVGAGVGRIRIAEHHMARKRVLLLHPVKSGIQFFLRQGPGHQGSLGQLGRQQRLAHAAHYSGLHHGFQPLDNHRNRMSALFGNGVEGQAAEPFDAVFRHQQNVRVDGVVGGSGDIVHGGVKKAGRGYRPARKAGFDFQAIARTGRGACCRTGRRKWRRIRGAGCGRPGRSAFRCAGVPVP